MTFLFYEKDYNVNKHHVELEFFSLYFEAITLFLEHKMENIYKGEFVKTHYLNWLETVIFVYLGSLGRGSNIGIFYKI